MEERQDCLEDKLPAPATMSNGAVKEP
jgi:hypothetical protein